jgi:hypothetical protein
MADVGFRSEGDAWKWRGNRSRRSGTPQQARSGNAFATALAGLKR